MMPDMTTMEEKERRKQEDRRDSNRRKEGISVKSARRLVPIDIVVGLILIGMILVGAVVYTKAVRFQRFIEPMLAVLQPRGEFSERFKNMIQDEFDAKSFSEMKFQGNILSIRRSFLMMKESHGSGDSNYKRLGRVFLDLFKDPWMRSNTEFILVSLEVPFSSNEKMNWKLRDVTAKEAELMLVTILNTSDELSSKYAPLFTSAAVSAPPTSIPGEWITFHLIPSERLHTEVLRRLEKYAH